MRCPAAGLPAILSSLPPPIGCAGSSAPQPASAALAPLSPAEDDGDRRQRRPRPHLVVHFDINETILVGDEAGGDTREDCLNKIIAKSAFVRIDDGGEVESRGSCGAGQGGGERGGRRHLPLSVTSKIRPTLWWDGTPIAPTGGGRGNGDAAADEAAPPVPRPTPLYSGWEWPPNSCPYYRTSRKRLAKTFTEGDGAVYRPMYRELEARTTPTAAEDGEAVEGEDGEPLPPMMGHLLPAFFRTIQALRERQRVTVVLRTFGTDLPDVAGALTAFARGRHPSFPDFHDRDVALDETGLFHGRHRRRGGTPPTPLKDDARSASHTGGGEGMKEGGKWAVGNEDADEEWEYVLYEWSSDDYVTEDPVTGQVFSHPAGRVVARGDEEVLRLIESRDVVGIQDDYAFWSSNGCRPEAGKPLWVVDPAPRSSPRKGDDEEERTRGDGNMRGGHFRRHHHHIFFDDNIHNDETDSILAIRYAINGNCDRYVDGEGDESDVGVAPAGFRSLSGREILPLHGRNFFRVPTVEAIMNHDWFLDRIVDAEARVEEEEEEEEKGLTQRHESAADGSNKKSAL